MSGFSRFRKRGSPFFITARRPFTFQDKTRSADMALKPWSHTDCTARDSRNTVPPRQGLGRRVIYCHPVIAVLMELIDLVRNGYEKAALPYRSFLGGRAPALSFF